MPRGNNGEAGRMDPAQRTKAIEQMAMACAGAAKAAAQVREAAMSEGDQAAARALMRRLWLEIAE